MGSIPERYSLKSNSAILKLMEISGTWTGLLDGELGSL
jgi:hypothetical protein